MQLSPKGCPWLTIPSNGQPAAWNCDTYKQISASGQPVAKSQLHKIAKYAQKLQHMIPDDHDLDDWMRSHISQAADDIGEVYHKLDYQKASEDHDH